MASCQYQMTKAKQGDEPKMRKMDAFGRLIKVIENIRVNPSCQLRCLSFQKNNGRTMTSGYDPPTRRNRVKTQKQAKQTKMTSLVLAFQQICACTSPCLAFNRLLVQVRPLSGAKRARQSRKGVKNAFYLNFRIPIEKQQSRVMSCRHVCEVPRRENSEEKQKNTIESNRAKKGASIKPP
ncbi:hypothetical protein BC940DRAFT_306002 [Gongronella butleri]|nr:hypothetical protein BC940DRAFT_306002 [Gongronella butleri]